MSCGGGPRSDPRRGPELASYSLARSESSALENVRAPVMVRAASGCCRSSRRESSRCLRNWQRARRLSDSRKSPRCVRLSPVPLSSFWCRTLSWKSSVSTNWARPMFGRSDHVQGVVYDEANHRANRERGLPTNFIAFPKIAISDLPDGARQYIRFGESQDLHKRFKCRVRSPWYSVPSVYSAPVGSAGAALAIFPV